MYAKPLELRTSRQSVNGVPFYTVDKVFPGIANVVRVAHKFGSYRDACDWCRREYHGIPVIRNA